MKALIALAAAALLLTGCSAQPVAPNSDIASLTFHQYQAIENFDDSEYTQDDPTEVARFGVCSTSSASYQVSPSLPIRTSARAA